MERAAIVDWVEGTIPETADNPEHLRIIAARASNTQTGDWFPDKKFLRYRMGVRHVSGMRALSGREDMGTHFIVSGSALTALKSANVPTLDLLRILLDHDARCTRLDLAIDAVDSKINFLRLYRDFDKGRAVTRAETWYLVQSGDKGWTLYIGAPQSDKHMRIYNKYAEVKHKATVPTGVEDWIRVELVLMRQWARRAARVLDAEGEDQTIRSFIRSFVEVPTNDRFQAVCAGPIRGVGASTRKQTDTKRWATQVVAKTFARETLADPTFWRDFMAALRSEIVTQRHGAPGRTDRSP